MPDVSYRTGYGDGTYGTNAFGVDGTTFEGASIIVTVSTTASAAVKVISGASVVVTSSSTVSDSVRIREGSAVASPAASVTASCVAVKVGAAATSCAASGSASAEKIHLASAAVSCAASGSAAATRVREGAANPLPALSVTANAEAIYQFTPQINLALSGTATIERVRTNSGLVQAVCLGVASGREKWEPPVAAVSNWTDYTPTTDSSIWSPAPQHGFLVLTKLCEIIDITSLDQNGINGVCKWQIQQQQTIA